MGSRSILAGMEVPVLGSDSLKWLEVSVPSSSTTPSQPPFAPPTEDAASCSIIGNPPTYLIWRIHKSRPRVMEIMELSDYKEFPRIGLQIEFPDALCPFAQICKDETNGTAGYPYMLYALTVSGVAHLIRLKNIDSYTSCSVFLPTEIVEFNIQSYPHYGSITAVAATTGCIIIGGNDGSVGHFQLGTVNPSAPEFRHELRDDAGLGLLWGLMSRGRTIAAVQDLAIAEAYGRKLVFVLHSDGTLRVWDLLSCSRIIIHTLNVSSLAGAMHTKLWVGEADNATSSVPLAVLCKSTVEVSMEMIYIYRLHVSVGDRIVLSVESSTQNISLEEGGLIDISLTSSKIWILKEDGLEMRDLFVPNLNGGESNCYALQESFVEDQLFQSSDHSSDDLLWLSHSAFSSLKDQVSSFVSTIFLRRVLLPGVHQNTVLRATLQDYNKHLTDSEFNSLTVSGLKKEILSLIEHQGVSGTPASVLRCWKTFCKRYFHYWCKNNAPCGLLIDSSAGAIGLIRKNSISLFRCLEDLEKLIYSSFEEQGELVNYGFEFSDLEREILFGVLRCVSNINQQLGRAASAIYYESLLNSPNMSLEEVIPNLLKVVETGHGSSISALHISELGADTVWEKEVTDHKSLRKFSVDMLLSLNSLCSKATSWAKVLDIIERYIKDLIPRKIVENLKDDVVFSVKSSVTVQSTSQVAKAMFESAVDIVLLLTYMVDISGQIHMLHEDVSRIQLELLPLIQEVVTEWHIIHFIGTTPSESPAIEDFSSQLSSLQIDGNIVKRSWNEKLGKCDFTLAFILLLNIQCSPEDTSRHLSHRRLPDPSSIINSVREFTSWIVWGSSGEESSDFFSHSTQIALVLLRHGQCDAVQYLVSVVDEHLRKERISESVQSADGQLSTRLHLLGCCLLSQAQHKSHGDLKEQKVCEAVRCFFRAASTEGAPKALQSLPVEARLPHLESVDCGSLAAWKLHYYQWAMQIFEQYNMSEGACQFALAALEQVDVITDDDSSSGPDQLQESPTIVRGRLWANVFKFTLDLNNYYDAYCAMISNPDEESKYICLRRFIIVLYEHGAVQILCSGQLPFIGLTEKVEQELSWKALRSDVSAKPNPFKLLYAFEMHRHNWRRASSYIYLYSVQLRAEAASKDHQRRSLILQERLNGLSAAINALHLVHPATAWIDPFLEDGSLHKDNYPSKKARITLPDQSAGDKAQPQRPQSYIDVQNLENEFVLASAEHLLSLANVKWTYTGDGKPSPDLVDLLVQSNLYDMAFTVLLKFWKGSGLQRQLERVFAEMSSKCCPSRVGPSLVGNDHRMHGLLLTSSKDEIVHGSPDMGPPAQQSRGNRQWETLELYLEKYKGFHPRLPVTVAETLLCTDPHIELPLWLVRMFKGGRRESSWGMAGNESDPASLLRLYVDYGRYAEATNLLLEYIESLASLRPVDIIRRKRVSGVWFPYTTIERLWHRLEELSSSRHMIDQCEKLKKLIHGTLLSHLNLLKEDSDDVMMSSATS